VSRARPRAPFRAISLWCRCVFFLLIAVTTCTAGTASLFVEQPEADFGVVYDDAVIEHCFILENRGDETLLIEKIEPGCGACSSYELETASVAPGKTAALEVSIDPCMVDGEVLDYIAIRSNDPTNPVLLITMAGSVVPRFEVRPKAVFMDGIGRMLEVREEVHIRSNVGLHAPLSRAESDVGWLAFSLAAEHDAEGYELAITTRPPLPEGLSRADVTISGDARDPKCKLQVSMYVPPVFAVFPEKLEFEAVADRQTRIIFVRQNTEEPVMVLSAETDGGLVKCEIESGPKPGNYHIYVYAADLAELCGEIGTVVIHTDDPARPSIRVPVAAAAPGP